jgi:trans-2-enoyl-CoA reductase
MRSALHVLALDGLDAILLLTLFANLRPIECFVFTSARAYLKTVNHNKKVLSILLLNAHELAVVVGVAFGRRQAQQARVFHGQNGHNDCGKVRFEWKSNAKGRAFEKKLGVNVRSLIDNHNVSAGSAGGL